MLAAEVGDQRVVGVEHELRVAAGEHALPSARRSSRARRSGRAGRGTGCRAGSRAGAARAASGASHSSSTSNRPSSPAIARRGRAAPSSVVAIPPAMFAPAWLWTSGTPARSRIAGGHRRGRRLAVGGRDEHAAARAGAPPSEPIAPGARRISTLPGALVPPPPRSRESAPTARASASFAASVPAIRYPAGVRAMARSCATRGPRRWRVGRACRTARGRAVRGNEHRDGAALRRARAAAARRSGRRRRTS